MNLRVKELRDYLDKFDDDDTILIKFRTPLALTNEPFAGMNCTGFWPELDNFDIYNAFERYKENMKNLNRINSI